LDFTSYKDVSAESRISCKVICVGTNHL
jgi:hypothetical protein